MEVSALPVRRALGWFSDLQLERRDAEIVAELQDFPISKMTGRFLNPATRESALMTQVLFRIPDGSSARMGSP